MMQKFAIIFMSTALLIAGCDSNRYSKDSGDENFYETVLRKLSTVVDAAPESVVSDSKKAEIKNCYNDNIRKLSSNLSSDQKAEIVWAMQNPVPIDAAPSARHEKALSMWAPLAAEISKTCWTGFGQ